MPDSALQFDGSQNYLDLGVMGNFGSNLGSGFYAKFQIKTTQTTLGGFGRQNSSNHTTCYIFFNEDQNFSNVSGKINIQIVDESNKSLIGATTSATSFNDGNLHDIIITADPVTNVITISIDGVSQAVSYSARQTPATFVNFNASFLIGVRGFSGGKGNYLASTVDNLKLGTSSSNLYGSYVMDEGSGTTTADGSGNGNTGTLSKGAGSFPSWVTGLSTTPTVTDSSATGIKKTQATGNGIVVMDGGLDITERGFVWSTSANPTTSDNKVTSSGSLGTYTATMSILSPNTTYHYRAYATNSLGTSYGSDQSFITSPSGGLTLMGVG